MTAILAEIARRFTSWLLGRSNAQLRANLPGKRSKQIASRNGIEFTMTNEEADFEAALGRYRCHNGGVCLQYAMVDGCRVEAFPSGKGTCPVCGGSAIAKCGTHRLHHWAHAARKECDPWWENESDWHRSWKANYPEECREVVHFAPNGEVHRSDIRTPGGIYIEVQHSHLPWREIAAREDFYRNLIWVLDGRMWRKHFDIVHPLPNPMSPVAADLVWCKAGRGLHGANKGMFFRLSENPGHTKTTLRFGEVHALRVIEAGVEKNYSGHHQFVWSRPHTAWLAARCPVYIDFGEPYLARLQMYDETGLRCVRLVDRADFVHATIFSNDAADVLPD